jgi:hypothetical protein
MREAGSGKTEYSTTDSSSRAAGSAARAGTIGCARSSSRFFRSLKEECTWQHNFASFREARRAIGRWIRWYNDERPHQALHYRSPAEFRAQKLNEVA